MKSWSLVQCAEPCLSALTSLPISMGSLRANILREKDGPMLLHDLQGSRILIPNRRDLQPDRDLPDEQL